MSGALNRLTAKDPVPLPGRLGVPQTREQEIFLPRGASRPEAVSRPLHSAPTVSGTA